MDNNQKISKPLDDEVTFALSEFLTRISRIYAHKLGNPIINARLAIEALLDRVADGDLTTKEYVNRLGKCLDEIEELSEQFSSSITGFVRFQPISIKSCIEKAVGNFDTKYLEEGGSIRINVTCDPGLSVYASALLAEHLYNLIENSVHAVRQAVQDRRIKNGFISIEGKQENRNDGSSFVIIKLLDNGGGIPADMENQIFRVGFTTKQHGSGFGLFAAQQYIRSIKGTLTVENMPGSGVAITIALPEHRPGS